MRQRLEVYGLNKAKSGLAGLGAGADARRWLEAAGPRTVRSLSLFLPGAGQIVRGRTWLGLFFLCWTGFMGAVTWAILKTIDRLAATLELLGFSVTVAFWGLGLAYVVAGALHLGSVLTAAGSVRPSLRPVQRPLASGVASLLIPGWGQLLNGDRGRGVAFLGGLWLVIGVRLSISPLASDLLNTYLPVVSPWEQLLREPMYLWTAMWTLPAVIWSLAVYDAATRATMLGPAGARHS